MDLILAIKIVLEKYPHVDYEIEDNSFFAGVDDGFTVWAIDNIESYTVGFDGWHEEFESIEDAVDCFVWGLCDTCRLKIVMRGTEPYLWTAQRLENTNWIDISTTGLLFFPFWRKAKTTFKQNALIKVYGV